MFSHPLTRPFFTALLSMLFGSFAWSQSAQLCVDLKDEGDEAVAFITVTADQNLISSQFSISWDAMELQFLRIESKHPAWDNAPNSLLFGIDSVSVGIMGVVWLANDVVNGVDYSDQDTLFTIRFNRLQASTSEILISNEPAEVELVGPNGILQVTTKDGISNGALVKGSLFVTEGTDCAFDSSKQVLSQWQIVALSEAGRIYRTVTGNDGSYYFVLPTGNYQIEAVLPNRLWSQCSVFEPVSMDSTDKIFHIGVVPTNSCSDLEVGIAGFHIEQCKSNKYHVNYRNWGTSSEDSAYIDISIDPFYTLESVSVPFETISTSYIRVYLNNIGVNQAGSFILVLSAACDIPLGQTHCMAAEIFPNNHCEDIDESWSGASLEVTGTCENDSVVFIVQNSGIGDMLQPSEFIITEDIVSFLKDNIQLTKAQSMRIPLLATGKTYRMEVQQVPFHPGSSIPRAHVEGCGPQPFSFGIVNQFEQNDRDYHRSETCLANRESFLPAELSAEPIGVSDEHYIKSNTDLEYTIGFQNTGGSMIKEIVVIDTLSPFLDIKTVRLSATSHLLKMSFLSDQIIKFTFPAINLTTQVNSEADSRGFVQFTVQQKEDNLDGTLITNRALLRFDQSGLTSTDQVFHIIGNDFFQTLGFESLVPIDFEVKAFPNPFHQSTRIVVSNQISERYSLEIFDMLGKRIFVDSFIDEYVLVNQNWPEGLYLAKISNSKNQQSIGKLYIR